MAQDHLAHLFPISSCANGWGTCSPILEKHPKRDRWIEDLATGLQSYFENNYIFYIKRRNVLTKTLRRF
jgi:hypothetical protein